MKKIQKSVKGGRKPKNSHSGNIMIKVYKAKISDAQEIRQLETKVWGEEMVNKYDIAMFVRFGWCFVAKTKNKMVGAIYSYQTKDNKVYVCDWIVDKNYRGKNIGMLLYKRLIKKLSGKDILTFLDLKNTPTLKAHQKLGFKVVKKVKNPYNLRSGIEAGYRVLVRLEKKK